MFYGCNNLKKIIINENSYNKLKNQLKGIEIKINS